ncbi:hypothetical protein [Priestia megaterium]|uniref:hypothetical protein n=1 Tax=Priestia megaterium TaxID=1404 RepID=UPI001865A41D|nr:hypothetical protein [Priestia megaterium]MBE2975821.1 hypothetical protein [Priestia megaterium]
MDNKEQVYSIEYQMSEVVFYKNISAYSFDEAKRQILQQHPNANIRAISIMEENNEDDEEHQLETE